MKKEDLIQENIELRSRLELAEKWMRREVATSVNKIQKEQLTRSTRGQFLGIWAKEGVDILTVQILTQFESLLPLAPKYTLERLIDAEIYWQTLQQYPQMDSLPIVLAYQKILDAWIEEKLIIPFRTYTVSYKSERKLQLSTSSQGEGIEQDIRNIITKKYTLSIGRLYQIISLIREGKIGDTDLGMLVAFWKHNNPTLLDLFISDEFFFLFTQLMERELFSRKRHEAKVTFIDAKKIREIMLGSNSTKSFLEMIFSI